MSSYLSEKSEFLRVQSSYNLSLINDVLNVKNARFDANVKAGQDAIDEFAKIDVISEDGNREKYVRDKVQKLTDYLNTSGNVNFERGNVQQQIRQQTSQILDDKILTDIANTAKYRNFQKEVAKAKEGKNGEYNQTNQEYALEKSGFNNWYKDSNAKSYDSLNYTNYTDGIKLLKDDIDKWGKEYGVHAEWTKEGNKGDLIYTDVKHEVLSKDAVLNRMKTVLNPQIIKQFSMDAWGHYKGVSEQDFHRDLTQFYTTENAKEDVNIARAKGLKTGATKAQIAQIDADIANYISNKNRNLEKINNGKYNPDEEKTNIYTSSLLGGLAESYQKDDEVQRITNDSNLDIAKFNSDIQYKKATLDQGQQRIDIAKEANKIADTTNVVNSGAGVKVDLPDETNKKTATEIVSQTNADNYSKLVSGLKGESKEYNALTTNAQRSEFIAGITNPKKGSNINTENYSANLIAQIDAFKASSTSIQKANEKIVSTITPVLINSYNNMIGSKTLDYNNLALTAPITAKYLKAGLTLDEIQKQVDSKGNPIGKQTVAMIKHEMAVNHLNFSGISTEEERHTLEIYAKNLENQSFLTTQQKQQMKSKDKANVNGFEGTWDLLSGIGNALGNEVSHLGKSIFNRLRGDEYGQKEESVRYNNDSNQIMNQFDRADKKRQLEALSMNPFREDTSLYEVERADLGNQKTGGDLAGLMSTALVTATSEKSKEYEKFVPKTYNNEGLAFNPADTKGKKVIESTILPQIVALTGTPVELAKGSIISTQMKPNSSEIQVTYTAKDSDPKTITIQGEFIPSVQSALYMKSPNHINSRLNENAPSRTITFETPTDSKDKFDLLKKININFGDNVISKDLVNTMGAPNSPLETQVSLRAMGKNAKPEIQQQIMSISTSAYSVDWENRGGTFVGTVKDETGKTIIVDGQEAVGVLSKGGSPSDYSHGGARLQTIQLINDVKKLQIQNLIK
jgi:hypothetical protein